MCQIGVTYGILLVSKTKLPMNNSKEAIAISTLEIKH